MMTSRDSTRLGPNLRKTFEKSRAPPNIAAFLDFCDRKILGGLNTQYKTNTITWSLKAIRLKNDSYANDYIYDILLHSTFFFFFFLVKDMADRYLKR